MSRSFFIVLATVSLVLALIAPAPSAWAQDAERPHSDNTVIQWLGSVHDTVVDWWKSLFAPDGERGVNNRNGYAFDDYGVQTTGDRDDEYGPYADPTGNRDP